MVYTLAFVRLFVAEGATIYQELTEELKARNSFLFDNLHI